MAVDSPVVARFRGILEARGTGDTASLGDAFANEDAAAAWQAGAPGSSGSVVAVFADAEHAVGITEYGDGVRQATIFHLDGDGRATEVWSVPPDADVRSALAGSPPAEHPNATRFRAAEEARARNEFTDDDIAKISEFLREDVEWHSPWGQGPTSREQVLQQFLAFKEGTGGSLQFVLHEVYADEKHAVSLVSLIADRPDKPDAHLDVREANVFHLDENGKCYEFWGLAEDQAAIDSFWS
jgi:hypothetical protein